MDGGLTAANRNIVFYSQGHAAAKPKLLKTNSTEITQVKDSGAKNTQEGWDAGTLHHLDILKELFSVYLCCFYLKSQLCDRNLSLFSCSCIL